MIKKGIIEALNGIKIPVLIFLGVFILSLCIRPLRISGESMENTYHDGQMVFGTKLFMGNIQKQDVVVVNDKGKLLIKRVIATGGDILEIKDGTVWINGKKINEKYIKEQMKSDNMRICLKKNQYFVMGDNRNHSYDSRIIGTVEKSNIVYKVIN